MATSEGLRRKTLKKLTTLLEKLEDEFYLPFYKLSGGYAEAVIIDYDEEVIYVDVKSGVDTEGRHYVDHIEIDHHTLEIRN